MGPLELFHVSKERIEPGRALRQYAIPARLDEAMSLVSRALDGEHAARAALLTTRGRLRHQFQADPDMQLVLLEAVFERIRVASAPHLPGRLESSFVWPTLELAVEFRERYVPCGIVHRCVLAEGKPIWRDASVVAVGVDVSARLDDEIRKLQERAERYWSDGVPIAWPEILVRGTVIVAEVLPTPRTRSAEWMPCDVDGAMPRSGAT